MSALIWMIPISLLLGLGFVAAFIWAVDNGQMQNLDEQAVSIFDHGTIGEDKNE